jgi:tetratricopeptide (TPR) repeat protein
MPGRINSYLKKVRAGMKLNLAVILSSFAFNSFSQNSVLEKARSLYDGGKLQEAADAASVELRKLKTTDTTYEEALHLRARCYMELHEYRSAIGDYKVLSDINPKHIPYYIGASYASWQVGERENCLALLQKALRTDPGNAGTLTNMSYYYGQAAKYEESIKYATKALSHAELPANIKASAFNNRGYSYLGLKQFDKALKDINQSIKTHQGNALAYCYRALANIGLNKMESVCSDLEKAKSMGLVDLTKDLIDKHCKKEKNTNKK